jgi:exosortase A
MPLLCALLFCAACWLFWPTLLQMEAVWRHSETYMHCYFILPMSLYMVWQHKDQLKHIPIQPTLVPLWFMLPVLAVWLSAYAIDVGFASHGAQVVFFQLLLWALLGHQMTRAIRFPLLFVIFAAPFGESVTPYLQDITAFIGVHLLRLADVPVYREGLYLHTPVSVFEVAVACSGLNFLISSTVISLLFAYLYFSKFYKQVTFVVFSIVLAILANGIRAFLLMYIGEKSQMQYGFGDDHYYYGWLVFGITVFVSFRIGEKFADPIASVDQPHQYTTSAGHPVRWRALMLLLLPIGLALIVSRQLPYTVAPTTPLNSIQVQQFTATEHSTVGTSFHDGMRRTHLINSDGVELFAADYALRQHEGDMITWHNWLFDPKAWTLLEQQSDQNQQYALLANQAGERKAIAYWYQCGERITTSRVDVKLCQLISILMHRPTELNVRLLVVPAADLDEGRRLLAPWIKVVVNASPASR